MSIFDQCKTANEVKKFLSNPKTLNTLTISIILLIISSISFTAISYVFKKRNNL